MKSVGFSQASTPLANFTIVRPTASTVRLDVMAAGAGFRSTSSRVVVVSFHGVTGVEAADASAPFSSASVGTLMPGFCGDVARMTRPSSDSSVRASAETSSSVIVGSSCWTSLYSNSMPGLGSPSRK